MMKSLTITDLCRRTGLTSRTLRFYDERGLVVAQRTAAGLRCYGPGEIARLHQVTALKRAGFGLAKIAEILGGQRLDLRRLIDAQLEALAVERDRVDEAAATLRAARSRLDAGRAIDIETFCTLIKQGETVMAEAEAWKKVTDQYVSPENKADWERTQHGVPQDFDQADYSARWSDLASRIEAALPMDPASAQARAFHDEWIKLLEPFTRLATPGMMADVTKLYDNMEQWSAKPDAPQAPFSSNVWQFINAVAAARKA